MDQNDVDFEVMDGSVMGIEEASEVIVYCRGCENACPVGEAEVDLDFILGQAALR
jgi:hypothetical protein